MSPAVNTDVLTQLLLPAHEALWTLQAMGGVPGSADPSPPFAPLNWAQQGSAQASARISSTPLSLPKASQHGAE